jgi:hypothetical protein
MAPLEGPVQAYVFSNDAKFAFNKIQIPPK